MNILNKLCSALLLAALVMVPVCAQAPAPVAGAGGSVGSFQQNYNTAWYASRPTAMQPLYWGRPGVPMPSGATPLTQAQFSALVAQLVAAPPVNPVTNVAATLVEQIDYYCWDPYTVNYLASLYGNTYFPAGQGAIDSLTVITQGQFTGTPPVGTTPVTLSISALTPWPASAAAPTVPVISDLVGPEEGIGSPYYGVLPADTSPAGTKTTDSRGTFVKVQMPSAFPIGEAAMQTFWQLMAAAH